MIMNIIIVSLLSLLFPIPFPFLFLFPSTHSYTRSLPSSFLTFHLTKGSETKESREKLQMEMEANYNLVIDVRDKHHHH